jgi:ABC-type branched-subunit amino acid transport system ATPase component
MMACHASLDLHGPVTWAHRSTSASNFTVASSIRNEIQAMIAHEMPVIEFLGVGIPDERGGWLLRRACVRLERSELMALVTTQPQTSRAFLDALSGRRIPVEGRIWVDGIPLMRDTQGRVRGAVGDAGPDVRFTEYRSVLWNTLVAPRAALRGLLRFPRRSQRAAATRALSTVQLDTRWRDPVASLTSFERARLALARALARRPRALSLRDVDAALGLDEAAGLLRLVRRVAHVERVAAVVSVASASLARACADRVIVLADGLVVFDGPAVEFNDAVVDRRLRGVVG